MKTAGQELTFYVPGLHGIGAVFRDAGLDVPRYPALEKLLARARRESYGEIGIDRELLRQFSLPHAGPGLPVAALAYFGLTGVRPEGWCLHADPVQLYPDRDKLLMLHPAGLSIRHAEAISVCEHLQDFYREDGWRFEATDARRWFMFTGEDPRLEVDALSDVMGHNINQRMPAGDSQRHWRVVLNEMQMLLHDSSVNRQRELNNLPIINSVWLWGAGKLPETVKCMYDRVLGDYPLLGGLVRMAGQEPLSLPAEADHTLLDTGNARLLVVNSDLHDAILEGNIREQFEVMARLEEEWFSRLLEYLQRGLLGQLTLIPGDGFRYTVTGKMLRRFWRRSRPVI